MNYYFDFREKRIVVFKRMLRGESLHPNHEILKKNLFQNFALIESCGLKSLYDIQQALLTEEKIAKFSIKSFVSIEYLSVLNDEIKSYHPTPLQIQSFEFINPNIIEKLSKSGIETSFQLHKQVFSFTQRVHLCRNLGINYKETDTLAKLSDFSRIRYLSQAFIGFLMDSKFDTINKIVNTNSRLLFEHLIELQEKKENYQEKITQSCIQQLIRDAQYISSAIEI